VGKERVTHKAIATVVSALLLVAGALVSGCVKTRHQHGGATKKTGYIRLAVVPKAVGLDYWEQVRIGADCAQSRLKDVKVQWDGVTQATDVNGQIDLLQNFITQGVDGLVYAAADAKALKQVTDQALGQGTKVVNIDAGTDPQPKEVPVFATNNVNAARKVPDLIAQRLGKKGGKIAFIPFQAGTMTNDQRQTGFKEGLKKHPELKLVATQSSESDYDTGLRVTEDILTAHPDLDAIFAANEPGVLGAAEAVRRARKVGRVVIVGWDAAPDEVKGVRAGVISALMVQNPFKMGFDGVTAAVELIRAGVRPKSEDTGAIVLTRRNIDDPKVQAVYKPSCARSAKG
jgi:ribose transport system substrate-binding protein